MVRLMEVDAWVINKTAFGGGGGAMVRLRTAEYTKLVCTDVGDQIFGALDKGAHVLLSADVAALSYFSGNAQNKISNVTIKLVVY